MSIILFFVEHSDKMLRKFYLFTDEKEPMMYDSYLCFLMEIETLNLGEYKGESRTFVKSKYVKNLVPMDDFPVEEHFNDNKEAMAKFMFTMSLIYRNI